MAEPKTEAKPRASSTKKAAKKTAKKTTKKTASRGTAGKSGGGNGRLVIVESPAKARTIEKYLGKNYRVMASVGHVRDLPKSTLGVDIENDFQPEYVTIRGKKAVLDDLKRAAGKAEEVFLATDPDREGEAIAWHVAEYLHLRDKPVRRATFNEITAPAVRSAIDNPSELDMNLCMAQQTRRILDRLVGYQISPLLWRKVRRGLSAGRVQSVAVRLVCEREEEIEAFVPEEYWNIDVLCAAEDPPPFTVRLAKIDGEKARVPNQETAEAIVAAVRDQQFIVGDVTRKEVTRNPQPPFITSTLQQEAARKLRFSPAHTMRVAQGLYEGVDIGPGGEVGLITYMRTDSTRVADQALEAVRAHIDGKFGKDYLPDSPRVFRTRRGAQDAHEAIRPTLLDRPPETLKEYLNADQLGLYQLIWDRFVASQMAAARVERTTVEVPVCEGRYVFAVTGSVVVFKGFLVIYEEGRDEEDERADEDESSDRLPALRKGQALEAREFRPEQRFTQPPPRFAMSSLVRELERRGIGRPSTYAQILSTILDKEYVERVEGHFRPTDLGRIVTRLLVASFPEIMDARFTARMEQELDEIGEGDRPWLDVMHEFYEPFKERLDHAEESMPSPKTEEEQTDIRCDLCGAMMVVKWGRNGHFLACSNYPECKNTKPFDKNEEGKVVVEELPETDEQCEKCGKPMTVKTGRRGPFLACTGYPECKNSRPIAEVKDGKAIGAEPLPETDEVCDKCGAPMIVRNGRRGPFLACSAFPKCRNAKDIGEVKDGKAVAAEPGAGMPEIDEKCDKCGAAMVIRNGRRGPFLACSAYPKCKNARDLTPELKEAMGDTAPKKPKAVETDVMCEQCGKPMVLREGRRGPFLGCSGYPKCKNTAEPSPEVIEKFSANGNENPDDKKD